MRLIHTSTLSLHEFHEKNTPAYAILSHTWDREEVSFLDFERPSSRTLEGYSKISKCCALADSDGWEYLWVDTCCIDKSSSAELSEAINSMYRWYQRSHVCYTYLSDVSSLKNIRGSRWFKRGWTLQELLAPENVIFYNHNWQELGTRTSLERLIRNATTISKRHLRQFNRNDDELRASVAQIMSWAALRETTRVEDRAYSLMGLFDVNMPLLYGEGMKAFRRLQEMILLQTSDESLFAWTDRNLFSSGLFAESPDAFANSGDIVPQMFPQLYRRPPSITNRGVGINIHSSPKSGDWLQKIGFGITPRSRWLPNINDSTYKNATLLLLNCVREDFKDQPLILILSFKSEDSYSRIDLPTLPSIKFQQLGIQQEDVLNVRNIYISKGFEAKDHDDQLFRLLLVMSPQDHHGFSIEEPYDDMETAHGLWIKPRNDLGGWEVMGYPYWAPIFIRNNLGEALAIEVNPEEKPPVFRVFVPDQKYICASSTEQELWSAVGTPMNEHFRSAHGTDRRREALQAGSRIFISLTKKRLDGEIVHVIHIKKIFN